MLTLCSFLCPGALAGKSENATISPMMSIPNAILKGSTMLIFAKRGMARIKNILVNDTRPLRREDIFLKRFSFLSIERVS